MEVHQSKRVKAGKVSPGLGAKNTEKYLRKMKNEIKVNTDTQHRQNIHATIHRLVQEGDRKELILNKLYKTFPNSNYKEYFSKWVEDQIKKHEKTSKNNSEREI